MVDIERQTRAPAFAARLPREVIALAYLAALGLILAPLFTADIPALVDYPNHLVRMHILSEIATDQALAEIYRVRWSAIPNLAMDVIVPSLAGLVGLYAAGKIFIGTILVLTVAGIAVLHRALYGRIGLWPLAVLPFLYNYVLAMGFLNFLFGVALMPFALAGWLKTERWPIAARLAMFTAVATILYFCHIAALAAYGVAIAAVEFHRHRADRGAKRSDLARRAVLTLAPFVVPVLLFLIHSGIGQGGVIEFDWATKFRILFTPTLFYGMPIDAQIFIVAGALLAVAIVARALRMNPAIGLAVIALAAIAAVLPTWFAGNWGNDFRLIPALVILAVAGSRYVPTRRWVGPTLAVGVIALTGARVADLVSLWPAYDRIYMETVALGEVIEPGARILPARGPWQDVAEVAPTPYARLFFHAPVTTLLGRPAFIPILFTDRRKQIVSVTEPYAAIDVPYGNSIPVPLLRRAVDPAAGGELATGVPLTEDYSIYAGWPDRFDYVLMMDFGRRENPLPALLEAVRTGSYFTLYRIKAPPEPAAG